MTTEGNAPAGAFGALSGACTPDFGGCLGYISGSSFPLVDHRILGDVPRTPSFRINTPYFLRSRRSTTERVYANDHVSGIARMRVSLNPGVHGVHGVHLLPFTWSEYVSVVPQAVPHVPQRLEPAERRQACLLALPQSRQRLGRRGGRRSRAWRRQREGAMAGAR